MMGPMAPGAIDVVVNGRRQRLPEHPAGRLLDWLRGALGLTGTKPGCGEGQCGACTVLLDGNPVMACQLSLAAVAGRRVTTIEGLSADGRLHPVQEAMVEEHAIQCGYCAPGMALRAAALLEADPDPDDGVIAEALEPNLCRCGGYRRLRRTVHRAAALRRGGGLGRTDPGPLDPGRGTSLPGWAVRPSRPWDLTAPEDRDHEGVLGPGLVSVWVPPPSAPGAWPASGGAWLHVAPSGRVTAFSGKVDVGQDNRTAFALLVAEELGADLDDVEVVEGDTDVCPFDIGTFGSRSMPDSGEPLRRAAAGARHEMAIEVAAGRSSVPADHCRVVVVDHEPTLVAPSDRRLVGRRGNECSPVDAVTGRRRYVSDLELPAMAHGAILRPPVPGATLLGAATSAAEALPEVKVVRAGNLVGVVAPDPATAHRAVAGIEAEWELPEPVAADLVGYLRHHPAPATGWGGPVDERRGDLEGALGTAAVVVEATYTTAYLAHVPLETRAAVARWDGERVTVFTGTQVPFGVRRQVAAAVGVGEADVRVVVPPTGGAFGGKHTGEVATEAALLAREAGCPVEVHWTRAEEFRFGTVRPMAVIDVRAGVDRDGSLVAWDFLDVNAGAAALRPPYPTGASRLRYQPAASPLRQGSYRALAANANNFARESVIDELAQACGADPVAFRLALLDDERLAEVLRAAADRFGWSASAAAADVAGGPTVGYGVALGLEKDGRVATCVELTVGDDRSVAVRRVVTAYECGTVVNPDTVVNQIEGATMMALGGALLEAVPVDHGRFVDPSLAGYPVPRFCDLPEIEVVLLDRPEVPSAGAGETPMIAVAPAVANALFDATGRRHRHLPLAPGRRLAAGAGPAEAASAKMGA